MKIIITMDVDGEWADLTHPMGITEEGFLAITGALDHLGTDISVRVGDEA